jgi:ribosomal protein L11 methyltransferase
MFQNSKVDCQAKKRRARNLDEKKWWTQGFSSVDTGAKLRIVPFWERGKYRGDRIQVVIDPGPAFGLGDHPTTIMALEMLEGAMEVLIETSGRPSVLDVGSGVGVLSIAAVFLGADFTVALDIDPIAVNIAERNFRINDVKASSEKTQGVLSCLGGIECVSGCFDLVMANLVAPLLLRIRKPLAQNSRNLLVLSGIFESMIREVEDAYEREGFELLEKRSRGEWGSVLFRRASE